MSIEFIDFNNGTIEIFRIDQMSLGTIFPDELFKVVFGEPVYASELEIILFKMKELQNEK